MLDLVLVTIVSWTIAGWLFWKWDIGCYRSEFQTFKERMYSSIKIKDPNVFPTTWRYE